MGPDFFLSLKHSCLDGEHEHWPGGASVADPYHFDPDPGSEKNSLRIRIQAETIRIQAKKVSEPGKSLKFD